MSEPFVSGLPGEPLVKPRLCDLRPTPIARPDPAGLARIDLAAALVHDEAEALAPRCENRFTMEPSERIPADPLAIAQRASYADLCSILEWIKADADLTRRCAALLAGGGRRR